MVQSKAVYCPHCYSLYSNDLIKEFNKSDSGVLVGDVRINNLAFADDIVLIANNEEELQELVSIASNHARTWRLTLKDARSWYSMVSPRYPRSP